MNRLESLSNFELTKKLSLLVKKENESVLDVLVHLNEFDKRKLYLELGYSSLFSYCTGCLKYSEPGAQRRIVAARCMAKYGEIYNLFLARALTLTTLSLIAPHLRDDNKGDILRKVSGKSKREVEEILATVKGGVVSPPKESIKPLMVRKEVKINNSPLIDPLFAQSSTPKVDLPPPSLPQAEERFRVQFTVSQGFMAKLSRVKAKLSHKVKDLSLESVVECLFDEMLKEPSAKRVKEGSSSSRYIPAQLKREVLRRDGFRCSYVSRDGKRCCESRYLEIDHIKPVAKGGRSELSNLRVLCSGHNRLMAERHFGKAHMAQCIGRAC